MLPVMAFVPTFGVIDRLRVLVFGEGPGCAESAYHGGVFGGLIP